MEGPRLPLGLKRIQRRPIASEGSLEASGTEGLQSPLLYARARTAAASCQQIRPRTALFLRHFGRDLQVFAILDTGLGHDSAMGKSAAGRSGKARLASDLPDLSITSRRLGSQFSSFCCDPSSFLGCSELHVAACGCYSSSNELRDSAALLLGPSQGLLHHGCWLPSICSPCKTLLQGLSMLKFIRVEAWLVLFF